MAKHPPGVAVNCYRIPVFMCFGSPSYGVGGEGDAWRSALLPALRCPPLCVPQPLDNPQPHAGCPTAYSVCPLSKATALLALVALCARREEVSSPSGQLRLAVCCCRCYSPPSVGISTVVLSMSLASQEQGTVPLGPSLRVKAMSCSLLRLAVPSGKETSKPNLLRVLCCLPLTSNPPSLLLSCELPVC